MFKFHSFYGRATSNIFLFISVLLHLLPVVSLLDVIFNNCPELQYVTLKCAVVPLCVVTRIAGKRRFPKKIVCLSHTFLVRNDLDLLDEKLCCVIMRLSNM